MLQAFEYALIVCTQRSERAWPAEISRQLSVILNRKINAAQLVVAINRLEDKQMMMTTFSKPMNFPGGRRVRLMKVTEKGLQEAKATRDFYLKLDAEVQP
jgi:hypothetical protein